MEFFEKGNKDPRDIDSSIQKTFAKFGYDPDAVSTYTPTLNDVGLDRRRWGQANLGQCNLYLAALDFRSFDYQPVKDNFCSKSTCTLTVTFSKASGVMIPYIQEYRITEIIDGRITKGQCLDNSTWCLEGAESGILVGVPKDSKYDTITFELTDGTENFWALTRVSLSGSACTNWFPTRYFEPRDLNHPDYQNLAGDEFDEQVKYNYCSLLPQDTCEFMSGKQQIFTCRGDLDWQIPAEINPRWFCDPSLNEIQSGKLRETGFCNYACSCSTGYDAQIPSGETTPRNCGTCDYFESEDNCPSDCCDWFCETGLEGGLCEGFGGTYPTGATWQRTEAEWNELRDNEVCHISLDTTSADNGRNMKGKCSVYCGGDTECHGKEPNTD